MSRSITLGRPLCAAGLDSRPARDLSALARLLLPCPPAAAEAPETNGEARPHVNRLLKLFGRSAAK